MDQKRNLLMMLILPQADGLLCLKKPWPARHAFCFQRRGDRKADCLITPAFIGDQQIGLQRIESPVNALNGGVIALEVYTDIGRRVPDHIAFTPLLPHRLCRDRIRHFIVPASKKST